MLKRGLGKGVKQQLFSKGAGLSECHDRSPGTNGVQQPRVHLRRKTSAAGYGMDREEREYVSKKRHRTVCKPSRGDSDAAHRAIIDEGDRCAIR